MKHQPLHDYSLTIEPKPPIVQIAIGAAITVVMTAVFYGFLFGTQS